MNRSLLLAALCWSCAARDPAVRPTYEIPAAPQSARPFATEEASVRAVRAVLQGAGFPVELVETSVEFNPVSDLPTLRGETVIVPRWLTPDADVAVRLAALLESTLGVSLDLSGWSDADAQAAWSALQVAQLTDQLMRVLDQTMGVPPDLSDPGALDRRAVDAHMPVLNALVAQNLAPATWPAAYRRLLAEVVPSLPADQALIMQHALDRADHPLSLGELIAAYNRPDGTQRRVEEAARQLSEQPATALSACVQGDGELDCPLGAGRLVLRYWEDQDLASVRLVTPYKAGTANREALLTFVNDANAFSVGACALYLEDGRLVAAGAPFQVSRIDSIVMNITGLQGRCGDYFEPFLSVAERGRPVDEVWAELRETLEDR